MTLSNRRIFVILSLINGGIFLLLGYLVDKDIFRNVDYQVTVFLQQVIGRRFDDFLSYFTPLGSSEITLLFLAIIFIYFLWRKKHLFLGLMTFILIFSIEIAGKLFIFHPDPPAFLNRYSLGIRLPSSFFIHTNFSFPSGHMARIAFLFYIILVIVLTTKIKPHKKGFLLFFPFVFFILTFISRIYLGEHWISDVFGGTLLGFFTASLAMVFW